MTKWFIRHRREQGTENNPASASSACSGESQTTTSTVALSPPPLMQAVAAMTPSIGDQCARAAAAWLDRDASAWASPKVPRLLGPVPASRIGLRFGINESPARRTQCGPCFLGCQGALSDTLSEPKAGAGLNDQTVIVGESI